MPLCYSWLDHGYLLIRNLALESFSYKCVNWGCFNVSEINFSESSGFSSSTFPPLFQAAHHVLVSQFSTKIPQISYRILLFPAFLFCFLGSRRYCIYHSCYCRASLVQALFLWVGPQKFVLVTALYAIIVSIILPKILYCIEDKPPFYSSWPSKNPSGGELHCETLTLLSCPLAWLELY